MVYQSMLKRMHTVRVFTDLQGEHGNGLGIMLDEQQRISPALRQQIAAQAGFSEVVFVNNAKQGVISIYNPLTEVAFAGHAVLGASFFLKQLTRQPPNSVVVQGKQVPVWQEDGECWLRAEAALLPPWRLIQKSDSQAIEAIDPDDPEAQIHTLIWSWIDEKAGIIRARTFAPDWGIAEDEANGSGCMALALLLNRSLHISHGSGSRILARSLGTTHADVGGGVMPGATIL